MFKRIILAGVIFCSVVASAEAATLTDVSGSVAVNSGSGFVAAASGRALKAGDKVMAATASEARVVYSADCSVVVKANQTFTVPAAPPCVAGGPNEIDAADLLIGGAIVAGTTVGIIALTQQSSESLTVSP